MGLWARPVAGGVGVKANSPRKSPGGDCDRCYGGVGESAWRVAMGAWLPFALGEG
jgi:hypothetical protein